MSALTDRQLLELAAKAIDEHKAWRARNAARNAFRKFCSEYRSETGEYFDRGDLVKWGEAEDIAKFDALMSAKKCAQKALAAKRAIARRAAASIGEKMP